MAGVILPAPTGGWNARDSLAEMAPNDAVTLTNIVPAGERCRTRPGYAVFTDTNLGAAVQTLVTYHGTTEKLIACADGDIVDVTSGTPSNIDTGFSVNKWNTTEFSNRIIFANGTDAVQDYDGTTLTATAIYRADVITNGAFTTDTDWTKGTGWTISGTADCDGTQVSDSDLSQDLNLVSGSTYRVTFTLSGYSAGTVTPLCGTGTGTGRTADGTYTENITAAGGGSALDFYLRGDSDFVGSIDDVSVRLVDSTDLIHCTTHQGRVYYIEDASQSFWYAGAGAYAGTLTEFDLSQFTTTGGDLLYMISWSRDGGAGMDDLAAFVFDTGEIIVYSGSDPSSSSDWAMLGRFRVGEPLGRKSAEKVGGDVIIATVDGYVPLSAALQEGRYSEQSAFSFKINSAAKSAAQAYRNQFGWEMVYWPQASLYIVNVPISADESQQHVRNTITGAWCEFTDIPASCWSVYGANLYFGSPDGHVYKMGGSSDNGAFIQYEAVQAFNYFGNPHTKKQLTTVQPITNFNYPKYLDVRTYQDFSLGELPTYSAPPESETSDWDVGDWDVAEWTSQPSTSNLARRNITGAGYAVSLVMRWKSRAQVVTWWASHLWFNPMGIV